MQPGITFHPALHMSSFKASCQNVLRRAGLLHRLRASVLYDWYWQIADQRVISKRVGEIEFYRGLLEGFRAGDLIFDIGANHGQKTDVFLRLRARVAAVEPDGTNQEVLRKKFLWLRMPHKPLVVVGKAVSDKIATEKMFVDAPGSAKNTLSRKWVDTLERESWNSKRA